MSAEGFARTAGERVGPYVLVAPLGRGGFSEVWRAISDRSEVALKLLIHPEHLAQLRREASALSLVRGEGIVPILGMGLADDPPWIALQLLRGGNLRQRMRRGALPASVAIVVFERILSILARVHKEGIVHGDLKPENVLFSAEELFLADFGLSRRITQRSASLSVSLSLEDARLAGTLDYMAPEQRSGEKPTARSDVFAAGVVLYELLTGERPQGVFKMPSEIDPSLPPVVDRIIACSLAQDPRHRFASAGPMLAFLRAGVTDDWKDLAQAQKRLETLVRLSAAGQAHAPGTTFKAVAIALGTLGIMAGTVGLYSQPWGFVRYLLGCAAAVVAVFGAARVARPWLGARYQTIQDLKKKVELQIRTGGEWSRAVRSAANGRTATSAPSAARGRRSPIWPPAPRPAPTGVGAQGFGSIVVLLLVLARACTTVSHSSAPYSPPPYQPSPYSYPSYTPPFTLPPAPRPMVFHELQYAERTSTVACWHLGERVQAVAPVGTLVFAATDHGLYRLEADQPPRLELQGEQHLLAAAANRIAAVADDGRISVLDLAGAVVATFDSGGLPATRIALSPDGARLALAFFSNLQTIDVDTGKRRQIGMLTDFAQGLAFQGEREVVALGRDGTLFHGDPGRSSHGELTWGSERPARVAVSNNGAWMAIQLDGGQLHVFKSSVGEGLEHQQAPTAAALALSDDGDRVLIVTHGGALYLHEPSLTLESHLPGEQIELAQFASGARYVTVDRYGTITLSQIDR